ncbi:hypothetical protein SDC9_144095 [bioreactor metagenome]|uniref:Uncharacterized protein n=1 Tax=bioreactor metagenome TaxID=1076179 RepID=A0A645E5Z0_9ZZZZ
MQKAEPKLPSRRHTVCDQCFSNALSALILPNGIACVADMSATANIVGMQNVQRHNLARFSVARNTGKGLLLKEAKPVNRRQFLCLRKCDSLAHNLIPNSDGLPDILCLERS